MVAHFNNAVTSKVPEVVHAALIFGIDLLFADLVGPLLVVDLARLHEDLGLVRGVLLDAGQVVRDVLLHAGARLFRGTVVQSNARKEKASIEHM